MESQAEQETPSSSSLTPSKAAAPKVSYMLEMFTQVVLRGSLQHLIDGMYLFFYFKGPMMPKMPQMDFIAELKKRQVKPQVREGKDGVLEDIITGRTRSWRRSANAP